MEHAEKRPRIGVMHDDKLYDVTCSLFSDLPSFGTFDVVYAGTLFDRPPECTCCGTRIDGAKPTTRGLREHAGLWVTWETATGEDVGAARAYGATLADSLQPVMAWEWSKYCRAAERNEAFGSDLRLNRYRKGDHLRLKQQLCDLHLFVQPDGGYFVASVGEPASRPWVCHAPVAAVCGDANSPARIADHFERTLRRTVPIVAMPTPMAYTFNDDDPPHRIGPPVPRTPEQQREMAPVDAPANVIALSERAHKRKRVSAFPNWEL